jgi:2-aminoadipate transaminase
LTPKRLLRHLIVAKQASDLHTGTLAQRATSRLLETFDYPSHVAMLCRVYAERCSAMHQALSTSLPVGSHFSKPVGGLFIWVELPSGLDASALLPMAVAQKLAYVPGAPFFAGAPKPNTLRLNFSNRPIEAIRDGMARLGRVFSNELPTALAAGHRQPIDATGDLRPRHQGSGKA